MAITNKMLDITKEGMSEQQYAEQHGLFMNMLGGCRWDPLRNRYVMAPIKYSDVDLTGEKIKFQGGQEFQVIFSCLASEYAHKQEVKDAWWEKAKWLVEQYKQQEKIEAYIKTNNTDLKKLRKEGKLLDEE